MKSGMFKQLDNEAFTDTFSVRSLSTRNACIVEITVMVQDQILTARGTSRRNPEDKHVPAYGQLLAYSRACESLAAKLERRGNGLLSHIEHIALQRPEQLRRSAEWHAAQAEMLAQKKISPVREASVTPLRAAGKAEKPSKAPKKAKKKKALK